MSKGPHEHGLTFRRIIEKYDAVNGLREYLQSICGTCGEVIEELEIIKK